MSCRSVETKYNFASKKKVSLFAYLSPDKAINFLAYRRSLKINDFENLALPSAYSLNVSENLQNPRIHLFYSSSLNLNQIHFLTNLKLKATCFRLNSLWYAYFLLDECNNFKKSNHLCSLFSLKINMYNKEIFYLLPHTIVN